MEIFYISAIAREALLTAIQIVLPILCIALVVGVIISVLQSATQIQESTLAFIPKMLCVLIGLIVFMPYMYKKMQIFMDHIIQSMCII